MTPFSKKNIHPMFLAFAVVLLLGCQSTPSDNPTPNCTTDVSDACQDDENLGEDRGYNPCLVNKKLPVCQK